MRFKIVVRRFPKWLVPAVYAMSGLAFVSDLYRDHTLAYGILYAPLVATSVCHRSRAGLWILSALACLMVLDRGSVSGGGHRPAGLIANRILSIMAIAATDGFVYTRAASRTGLPRQHGGPRRRNR